MLGWEGKVWFGWEGKVGLLVLVWKERFVGLFVLFCLFFVLCLVGWVGLLVGLFSFGRKGLFVVCLFWLGRERVFVCFVFWLDACFVLARFWFCAVLCCVGCFVLVGCVRGLRHSL